MRSNSRTPLSLALALLSSIVLAGCVGETAPDDPAAPSASDPAPSPVEARHYRIGVLQLTDALVDTEKGYFEALAQRGYSEGSTVTFTYRHSKGNFSALPALAAEIAAEKPDLILALTYPAARAALAATEGTSIPVIGAPILSPVGPGFAETVERPGGRFTAVSPLVDASKQVEVLRESLGAEPSRLGIITSGDHGAFLDQFKRAAGPAGFDVTVKTVANAAEVEAAFHEIAPNVEAIYVPPDNVVTNSAPFLIEQSRAAGIALMVPTEALVEQGGFVAYSADYTQLGRQAARMTANILEGASVSETPVEYPERTRLAVNLVTANAIGVDVPDTLLARAAKVVR